MRTNNLIVSEVLQGWLSAASNIVVEYEPALQIYKLKSVRPLPMSGSMKQQIIKPNAERKMTNNKFGYFHYYANATDIKKIIENQVVVYQKRKNTCETLHMFNIQQLMSN